MHDGAGCYIEIGEHSVSNGLCSAAVDGLPDSRKPLEGYPGWSTYRSADVHGACRAHRKTGWIVKNQSYFLDSSLRSGDLAGCSATTLPVRLAGSCRVSIVRKTAVR